MAAHRYFRNLLYFSYTPMALPNNGGTIQFGQPGGEGMGSLTLNGDLDSEGITLGLASMNLGLDNVSVRDGITVSTADDGGLQILNVHNANLSFEGSNLDVRPKRLQMTVGSILADGLRVRIPRGGAS